MATTYSVTVKFASGRTVRYEYVVFIEAYGNLIKMTLEDGEVISLKDVIEIHQVRQRED